MVLLWRQRKNCRTVSVTRRAVGEVKCELQVWKPEVSFTSVLYFFHTHRKLPWGGGERPTSLQLNPRTYVKQSSRKASVFPYLNKKERGKNWDSKVWFSHLQNVFRQPMWEAVGNSREVGVKRKAESPRRHTCITTHLALAQLSPFPSPEHCPSASFSPLFAAAKQERQWGGRRAELTLTLRVFCSHCWGMYGLHRFGTAQGPASHVLVSSSRLHGQLEESKKQTSLTVLIPKRPPCLWLFSVRGISGPNADARNEHSLY